MPGYAANGPAPPAYLLLAGPAYMSPSRTPTQGDKLDKLLEGVAGVQATVAGVERQLTEVRGNVSDLGERMAKAENANASTARANVNGYREHARTLSDLAEKLGLVTTHLDTLDNQVQGLSSVAKEATLEAAPDVAKAVAERVNEEAKPDRKRMNKNVIWTGVCVAFTACIWPFVNNVAGHPLFWKQLIGNIGQALAGVAKIMPTG